MVAIKKTIDGDRQENAFDLMMSLNMLIQSTHLQHYRLSNLHGNAGGILNGDKGESAVASCHTTRRFDCRIKF
jgi:hypothetical protein